MTTECGVLSLDLLTRMELETAAYRQGYRLRLPEECGWLRRRSTNVPGSLWLAGVGPTGPFFAATDHRGIAREVASSHAGPRPDLDAWRAETIQDLHILVDRIYRLSVSLPTHPLTLFAKQIAAEPTLPTETEAMKKVRIAQGIFRESLVSYWKGSCPLTGISEPALLRASHIRPWAECDDAERLDVHNGLLLSALWDAAFDRGLTSFDDDGRPLFAPKLDQRAREALENDIGTLRIDGLRPEHRMRLADHRSRHGFTVSTNEIT